MKTKIVYISGSEIFDINDIRNAFEEVRKALNIDKDTVFFGVPIDSDNSILNIEANNHSDITKSETEIINQSEKIQDIDNQNTVLEIPEQQTKKRGRPKKDVVVEPSDIDNIPSIETNDDKVVPILSVLSTESEDNNPDKTNEELSIEKDLPDDIDENEEHDLEKLLSEMTPLHEDITDTPLPAYNESKSEDIPVDATLKQLASEFIENEEAITVDTKNSSRSKIGKLRNILPFKQSKNKDKGVIDLLNWGGIAANEDDFSVPGYFTNTASKK